MLGLDTWGFGARIFAYGLAAIALLSADRSHAEMTVLIGEPFGSFGTMMPVGHTSIYLDRVCADGPLRLRMCTADEPQGVVIARYHRIADTDWIATPVLQFLYATDKPEEIPAQATPAIVREMRERYRKRYMSEIVPDGTEYDKGTDEWWETAGMAYDRRIWGYQIATTVEQDEALIQVLNAGVNRHRYNMNLRNCADFAADIVNFYHPGSVRRDHIADFGWMTPKQVARSVERYGTLHAEAHLRKIEVPQVPGTLRRSRPVRGAAEGLLKTKRYLATLLVVQPEVAAVTAILYLNHGRWSMGKGAEPVTAQDLANPHEGPGTIVATGESLASKPGTSAPAEEKEKQKSYQ